MAVPVQSVIALSKRVHPYHRHLYYVGRVVPPIGVAGTVLIEREEMGRALGSAALALWEEMLAWRDGTWGRLAFKSDRRAVPSLARHANLTARQVLRALAKLYRLGLVAWQGPDLGPQFISVPQDRTNAPRQRFCRIFVREVLGAKLEEQSSSPTVRPWRGFCVPRAAAPILLAERGRGGARAGAGRPKSNGSPADSNRSPTTGSAIQTGLPKGQMLNTRALLSLKGQKGALRVRAPGFPSGEGAECSPKAGNPAQPVLAMATKDNPTTSPSVGTTLQAALPAPRDVSTSSPPTSLSTRLMLSNAPSRPCPEIAVVPGAPMFDGEFTDLGLAQRVMDGYRAALAGLGHDGVRGVFQHDIRRTSAYRTLVQAGRMLLHHGINPMAWAAWRQRWWKGKNGDTAIPVRLCFSPESIAAQHGWWENPCVGGRGIYGPRWRELAQRWERMRAEVWLAVEDTAAWIAAVERNFPPGEYERMLALAQAEADAEQAVLDVQARRGEWITYWGP